MYELFLKTGNVPFAFRFFVVRGGYFLRRDAAVLVIFNEYFSVIAHILHIGIVSLPSKQAERMSSDLFFQFFVAVVPLRFGLLDECFVCDLLINLNYFSGERRNAWCVCSASTKLFIKHYDAI